ncbi:MAG: pyridoxal phosphate-dependent aminotransferase [Oscillospiraceae bacterium]|nr:pyridoxal phosphate-dependent aminotransferase [Oscillospiraceae bacterium]
MIAKEMYELGAKSSVIREIFEYGKKRKAEVGAENVYDYSLGNPSVPAPASVNDAIRELCDTMNPCDLHGYTSAVGDNETRQAIADNLNSRFGTHFTMNNLYMTCGAAASLCITFRAIAENDDEIIIFAPYFPEYKVFISAAGATPVEVKCKAEDLTIDLAAFEKAITPNTKAVVINSPNNPSGVVVDEETVKALCAIMKRKSEEIGRPIFLVSDEPYRELVYGDVQVPYLTKYYDNTIVCYSFSKSLSLPGDRIGYILVPDEVADFQQIYKAICGAGRSLGYVCAPSLMQFVIRRCVGQTSDVSVYQYNRDLLLDAFEKYGFKVAKPDGAFYLFMKSPEADAAAFCEKAKKYDLLLVPSDSFGFPGYVRLAYCVSTEMIKRSLPSFKALAEEYGLI